MTQQDSTETMADFITDPVTAIRVLPAGAMYTLDSFRAFNQRKGRIMIGRSPYCDIVLHDIRVSARHCYLRRANDRVFVVDAGSKNGVRVNGFKLCDGVAELSSGSVIEIGATALLACGRDGIEQQACIAATELHEYLDTAVTLYGSLRGASRRLDVAYSTLRRWLSRGRFKRNRGA